MNNEPSTSLRAINRLYKEAEALFDTDPIAAGIILENARQRMLTRNSTALADQRKLAEILLLAARCERRPSHADSALEYAYQALPVFESLRDAQACAQTYNVIGVLHWMKGVHGTAQEFFKKSVDTIDDFPEASDARIASAAATNLGMICWYLGDYEQALFYMKKGLASEEAQHNYRAVVATLLNIGNLYSNSGNAAEALAMYLRGLDTIATHIPEHPDRSSLLAGIGSVFLSTGEYDRALEHYLLSLELAEKAQDSDGIATALLNTGLVYKENKQYETALEYIVRSQALRETMQDDAGKAVALVNRAAVLCCLGKYDESLLWAEQSAELCRISGDRRVLSYALQAMGEALLGSGDYGGAIARMSEGLDVRRDIGYVRGQIASCYALGGALCALGQIDKAEHCLQTALELAAQHGEKTRMPDIHKSLAELYQQQHNERSILHYKQAYELREVVLREQANQRIHVLQVLHEVAEARKEAEIYRLKTEQLEQKIEEQSREMASKTMHLTQHADFLHRIKKMLSTALSEQPTQLHKHIREAIAVIDSTLSDEQAWNAFTAQFQQMHPMFVESMRQRFPSLSSVELRVCSLLRLNLSSKEICRVLNIAPRSVDVYRHRIRKKLELSSEENLTAFLATIA